MRKRKEHSLIKLIELYINYIFNRTTIIVLLISFILMILFLFVISDVKLDLSLYQQMPLEIHNNYFKQAIFILSLFNGVINTSIVITLSTNSEMFDRLFISYTTRKKICIAKLFAYLISIVLVILIEALILYFIPLMMYPSFIIDINIVFLLLYLLLQVILECVISMVLVTMVSNIFIPMIVMFIFTVFRIICNNFSIVLESMSLYFPVIEVENGKCMMNSVAFIPMYIVFFIIFYILIYEIKDLS